MTDWTAWLGPAAAEMTVEQRSRFEDEAALICEQYADPDLAAERDAALSAVVQYLLGDTTPEEAGRVLAAAREAERAASIAAQTMARMVCDDGMSEVQAAQTLALDRMTVRKARGK
jgi:hypothetical protein